MKYEGNLYIVRKKNFCEVDLPAYMGDKNIFGKVGIGNGIHQKKSSWS